MKIFCRKIFKFRKNSYNSFNKMLRDLPYINKCIGELRVKKFSIQFF